MRIAFIKSGLWFEKNISHPEENMIYSLSQKYKNHSFLRIGSTSEGNLKEKKITDSLSVIDIPIFTKYFDWLISKIVILIILLRFKPDLVIALGDYSVHIPCSKYRLLRKNTRYLPIMIGGFKESAMNTFMNIILKLCLNILYPQIKLVPVISEDIKDIVVNLCPEILDKTVIYSYPINPSFKPFPSNIYKEKYHHKGYLVLSHCRIIPRKGLDVLVRAVANIIKIRKDILFVIRGPPPGEEGREYLKYLEKLVIKLNLSEYIKFDVRILEYTELPIYINSADVYVLPTLDEPLGLSVLEALYCNVPVIASNVGGIPDMVSNEENGLLVNPGDENALTEAILRVFSDGKLFEKMKNNARKYTLEHYYQKKPLLTDLVSSFLEEYLEK